jgi:hypothetical protein
LAAFEVRIEIGAIRTTVACIISKTISEEARVASQMIDTCRIELHATVEASVNRAWQAFRAASQGLCAEESGDRDGTQGDHKVIGRQTEFTVVAVTGKAVLILGAWFTET